MTTAPTGPRSGHLSIETDLNVNDRAAFYERGSQAQTFPGRAAPVEIAGRPACLRLNRRIAVAKHGWTATEGRLLTGSLLKERILAAEAVGTVENSERVFCGEFSKRGGNGGKPAFWVFHGFHGAAVSTASVGSPHT